VHPITRRLPQREFIAVEQGLLTSFGRVMPILMPLTLIAAITFAISVWDEGGWIRGLAAAAAVSLTAAVISTVIFNVPINLETAKWDPDNPPRIGRRRDRDGSSSEASARGFCWLDSC
jgi:uncharacterized membrane protein